jgi:hypothetical protein
MLLHLFYLGDKFTPICNTGSDTIFEYLCEYNRNTYLLEDNVTTNTTNHFQYLQIISVEAKLQLQCTKLKQLYPSSWKIGTVVPAALLAVT